MCVYVELCVELRVELCEELCEELCVELCVELYEVLNGIICFKSSKAPKSYLFDMPVYMWWLSWNLPHQCNRKKSV